MAKYHEGGRLPRQRQRDDFSKRLARRERNMTIATVVGGVLAFALWLAWWSFIIWAIYTVVMAVAK